MFSLTTGAGLIYLDISFNRGRWHEFYRS